MTFTIPELALAAIILLLLLIAVYQTGTSRGEHERRMLKANNAMKDLEIKNLIATLKGIKAREKLKVMGRST